MEFLDVLKARKSVRYFDKEVIIPTDELNEILREALLAPSGNNLQPWHVFVVTTKAIKSALKDAAFGQQQVEDAPVVFALFANKEGYKNAEKVYNAAVKKGYMTEEAKNKGIENMHAFYGNANPNIIERNVIVDTSLLAMQLMLVLKNHGYDSVPMSGYNSEKVAEILKVNETMVPIMLLPAGKALKGAHNTIRLSVEDVTTVI